MRGKFCRLLLAWFYLFVTRIAPAVPKERQSWISIRDGARILDLTTGLTSSYSKTECMVTCLESSSCVGVNIRQVSPAYDCEILEEQDPTVEILHFERDQNWETFYLSPKGKRTLFTVAT